MDALLQHKHNKYYIVFYTTDSRNKRRQKWVSTGLSIKGNKLKAEKLLNEYLLDQNFIQKIEQEFEDTYKNVSEVIIPNDIYFADYLHLWLKIRKPMLQPYTYKGYCSNVALIYEYFNAKKIRLINIKPLDIQNYYQYMWEKGNTANTIIHHHAVIHHALKTAYKHSVIESNPADKIEKPRKEKFKAKSCSLETLQKILKAFEGHFLEIPIILTVFYSLRREEALGVRWSVINFEKKILEINHKIIEIFGDETTPSIQKSDILKTDASYAVYPLLDFVIEKLKKHKEKINKNKTTLGEAYSLKDEDYVCVNDAGYLIKPDTFTKSFPYYLEKYGFERIRVHDLRHAGGDILQENGRTMKDIQTHLRHASYKTTADTYVRLSMERTVENAMLIEQVITAKPKDF